MDELDRERLAQRLSAMSLKDARKEILRLDPDADMKFYRNAMWHEYHTLFVLPNKQVSITLVEEREAASIKKRDAASGSHNQTKQRVTFTYVAARVAPLDRPIHNKHAVPEQQGAS